MYTIAFDPGSSIVRLSFAGFLDVAEVRRYGDEFRALLRRERLTGGFSLLIDVSAAAIQSQEVVAAFQAHMAGNPVSRRIAIVTGASAARMQIRRLLVRSYARLFVDADEAQAWLSEHSAIAA